MALLLLHWLLLPQAPAISAQWADTTCPGTLAWQLPFHMEQMALEACCELACQRSACHDQHGSLQLYGRQPGHFCWHTSSWLDLKTADEHSCGILAWRHNHYLVRAS